MNPFLHCSLVLAIGLELSSSHSLRAGPAVLTTEHVDIGVAFEGGEWDLHIHDETHDIEYAPSDAILQVNASARTQVPSDSRYSFLGDSGTPIFILPQVQNSNLIFLGTSAEELPDGVFAGDRLHLRLSAFEGPGRFFSYLVSGLDGSPERVVEAGSDGVDPSLNAFTVLALGHQDYNWAFTEPGTYKLTFQATGEQAGQGSTTSQGVQYTFLVVPEPSGWFLSLMGGAGLFCLRSRRSPGARASAS